MSEELRVCECKDVDGARLHRDVNSYGACQVRCENCGRSGPSCIEVNGSWKDCTAEEAIAAWNARPLEDELVTALEKMVMNFALALACVKDQKTLDMGLEEIKTARALIAKAKAP